MYIIAKPPRLKGVESIVQNGLLEEYRFDESSGDVLIGYKNGYHGTFGSDNNKPARLRNGVLFSTDDFIILPNQIRDMLSVSKSFTVITVGLISTGTILGSTISSTDRMTINVSPVGLARGNLYNIANYNISSQETMPNVPNIISYLSDNTKSKLFVNKDNFRNGIQSATPGPTVACKIGVRTTNSVPLEGILYYMLFYTRFLTDSEVLRNCRVIKSILKLRGVIVGD